MIVVEQTSVIHHRCAFFKYHLWIRGAYDNGIDSACRKSFVASRGMKPDLEILGFLGDSHVETCTETCTSTRIFQAYMIMTYYRCIDVWCSAFFGVFFAPFLLVKWGWSGTSSKSNGSHFNSFKDAAACRYPMDQNSQDLCFSTESAGADVS